MQKVKCAVLGASGVVGQNFLRLLVDHPYFDVTVVAASESRVGQKFGTVQEQIKGGVPAQFSDLVFDPISVDVLVEKGVQVAFSGLPADIAINVEKEAAKRGIKVFSNAGSYRMDEHVPILIPEINYKHMDMVKAQGTDGYIVTNANCTTTGLTMALLPIADMGIDKLVVASYQAISGAGYPGIPTMDILANVIPYIGNEEPKMVRETNKIFGDVSGSDLTHKDWEIHAHCVRVQTVIGHLISVHVELDKETTYEKVLDRIQNYKAPDKVAGLPTAPETPIYYMTEENRPQPRYDVELGTPDRAKGMAIAIGRLSVEKNIIRFVTISNNLVRGAAGGSVLNAELAYREGLL